MTAHTIPREQWAQELEGFGQQHHDWLVSLRRCRGEEPPEVLVHEAPLESVRLRRGGGPDAEAVDVVVRDPGGTVAHRVHRPWVVSAERAPSGEHAGLTVVSHDGERTELRFRAAVLPEAVDGVI